MGCSNSTPMETQKEKTTVFLSKEMIFRIPGLIFDHERKTLLAFAEKRKCEKDSSSVALVMKAGNLTKAGNSWAVEWSDSKEVVKKKDLGGHRPMNPCPIYAKKRNTIYLFFIGVKGTTSESHQICWGINETRLYYIATKDGGGTWSDPVDLTETLPEIKNWATFGVGPGHGIQTETGKLIVPAYAYPSCSSCCKSCRSCLASLFCCCDSLCCTKCCPPPHALIICGDNVENFKCGNMLEQTSLECEIAETSTDQTKMLYCNARSQGGFRVEAFLDDREDVLAPSKLVETNSGCQGSVVSFPAQPEEDDSNRGTPWLLYSHPTSKCKRVDLGVYLNKSPTNPSAWSNPWIINEGPSGYSDLTYIEDGWFACLMECGEKTYTEEIACSLFSYDDIQKGITG
ncbi:sialidase-3-like [Xiphophorus hellerii]|uniref:sialidase-3-like n=1 Tax=Xiphophorus hellerii TaxID=8084 RepID=UPI0013B358A9|nr:sialidase-3-like [Xiphophorus hellerii]